MRRWGITALGILVGFGLGAGIYLLVNPVLEASDGLVQELQGMLWNIVPGLTVAGGIGGWMIAARSHDEAEGT